MKTRHFFYSVAALAALAFASSCSKDADRSTYVSGNAINFGVNSSYQNGAATKTEYSGVTSGGYERINWVSGDRITILCEQAYLFSGPGKSADYKVTGTPKGDGKESKINISSVNSSGLQWGDGTFKPHCFYALYPSKDIGNGKSVSSLNKIETVNTSDAKISGEILATQAVELSGKICKPNMNYAYMYAVNNVTTEPSSKVITLEFKPLVTTFRFIITTLAGSESITEKLKKVTLSSTQTSSYLSGKFAATLTSSGLTTLASSDITDGGNSITIDLGAGVTLSSTDPYEVTFFALPMDQTNLTITLQFETMKRVLELKKDGSFITVPACRKMSVKLGVPKTINIFDVVGPATSLPLAGGTTASYSVTSQMRGGTVPVAWSVTGYSEDYGTTWNTTAPSWLTVTTSGAGGASTSYNITATANTNSGDWGAEVGTSLEPRDLSCYDIYGTKTGGTEGLTPYNTANSYVISAPGWYRLPCVYGNAIKNGSDNKAAYESTYTGENSLPYFVNHAGKDIKSPWIRDNKFTDTDNITIDGARLVWQDIDGLITNVSKETYNGKDYIKFYVQPTKLTQANALVAALSGTGIVWSWHLWFVDNPSKNLAAIPVYSSAAEDYKSVAYPNHMLVSALGFTRRGGIRPREVLVKFKQAETGIEKQILIAQDGSVTEGWFITGYQWGRKDPLPPMKIGSTTSSGPVSGSGFTKNDLYNASGPVSIPAASSFATSYEESIKNPMTFYKRVNSAAAKTTSWFNTIYYNLWNSKMTELAKDDAVTKTVYDPCPPGFKVPNRNAFTGFTSNPNADTPPNSLNSSSVSPINGFYVYDRPEGPEHGYIFLLRPGYVGHASGNIITNPTEGKYWTAAYASDGKSVYFMNVKNSAIKTLHYNSDFVNAGGFTIQPVAE